MFKRDRLNVIIHLGLIVCRPEPYWRSRDEPLSHLRAVLAREMQDKVMMRQKEANVADWKSSADLSPSHNWYCQNIAKDH